MQIRIAWEPQPGPQAALISCPSREVFFGGARGGGKTDGAVGLLGLRAIELGRAFNGLFVRRELPMLDDAIERSFAIYASLGADYNKVEKTWRFPGGGRLRFRPLERVQDADKYQGQNITHLVVEEAGQYPDPRPIDRLQGVLRSAAGVRTQMILTGNPGGAGQFWIKARYIDPNPLGFTAIERVAAGAVLGGHRAVFIPSRIKDNRILFANDPEYVQRLHLVGSAAMVRAWLEGDWGAVEGAFFDGWSAPRHIVPPFALPAHWLRFRAMDWGSAAPFCVHWVAVASEDLRLRDGRVVPRHCLVFYREWYGANRAGEGAARGLKLTAEQVAAGIRAREAPDEKVAYGVLDPAAFAQDGGPSIAERMMKAGVMFRPADNRRVDGVGAMGGWDQLRARLLGDGDGRPMLVAFSTCADLIRTLPVLQHDEARPEDVDTDSEDHAADACRYACMSRPWTRPAPETRHRTAAPGFTYADVSGATSERNRARV